METKKLDKMTKAELIGHINRLVDNERKLVQDNDNLSNDIYDLKSKLVRSEELLSNSIQEIESLKETLRTIRISIRTISNIKYPELILIEPYDGGIFPPSVPEVPHDTDEIARFFKFLYESAQ